MTDEQAMQLVKTYHLSCQWDGKEWHVDYVFGRGITRNADLNEAIRAWAEQHDRR